MSSVDRAGPSKRAPDGRRWEPPSKPKREQIAVACEACRQRKSKCNGERPTCKLCRERKQPCEYTSEPGISPIASLKRKYETLQAESADEHDLLGFLRTASEGDAIKALAYLRSSDDVQSTLYQARNNVAALEEPLRQETPDIPYHRPTDQTIISSDLQATSDSRDAPSMYPELSDSNGRIPWALPIEPSEPFHDGENTLQRKTIRRTPSAPELAQSRKRPTIGVPKHPVARSDPRLDNATTERWGITFISDDILRKVMTCYIVWDHTGWAVFDIDDFCRMLSGDPSELSSRLLVMAVLAHALRLYVHFDPEVAYNYGIAREETDRLWQESIDNKDDSLATAAASGMMFILNGSDGFDKHGREPLLRAQNILLDKGLFDPHLVDQVYNHGDPARSRSRAALAWGILQTATIVEFYNRSSTLLLTVPPVPMTDMRAGMDVWTPWPMIRPNVKAHTYELDLARARLWAIIRDMLEFQSQHGAAVRDAKYLDAVEVLYSRYQAWMSSLDLSLRSSYLQSQQQILTHATYYFAIFELFRPVTTNGTAAEPNGVEGNAPPGYAIAARADAIKSLRQLLVCREALYGGLGVHPIFSSPALVVVFDALPTASPDSPEYTPSAHMALLTGLRLLMQVARSMHVVYYAVLSVQQAAARSGSSVPIEAEEIFKRATKALEQSKWQQRTSKEVSSDWVVDFSRPVADDEDARLSNLVAKMDRLNVEDGEREGS